MISYGIGTIQDSVRILYAVDRAIGGVWTPDTLGSDEIKENAGISAEVLSLHVNNVLQYCRKKANSVSNPTVLKFLSKRRVLAVWEDGEKRKFYFSQY